MRVSYATMRWLVLVYCALGTPSMTAAQERHDDYIALDVVRYGGCGVTEAGRVRCWGLAPHGGARDDRAIEVRGLRDAVEVRVAYTNACARRRSGQVACWRAGQPAADVAGARDAAALVSTDCFVRTSGRYACGLQSEVHDREGLEDLRQVAIGENHRCGITTQGRVVCAGSNGRGQLGRIARGGERPADMPAPAEADVTTVAGVEGAVSIAASSENTCVALTSGEVACWGSDYHGINGDGAASAPPGTVVRVRGLDDAVAVESSAYAICALRRGGQLACWGGNGGQLGPILPAGGFEAPSAVPGIEGATSVSMGYSQTCVLLEGAIQCLGATLRYRPTRVAGLIGVTQLATREHTSYAIDGERRLWVWGEFGRRVELSPLRLPLDEVLKVATSRASSVGSEVCVVHGRGALACVRHDERSFTLELDRDVLDVAVGQAHVCALMRGGRVRCRGSNDYGALGDTSELEMREAFADVPGVRDGVSIASSGRGTCVTARSGEVTCWGDAIGASTDERRRNLHRGARREPALGRVAQLAFGYANGLAVRTDGTVMRWGYRGDYPGSNEHGYPALTVAGLTQVVQASTASGHSCAVRRDGTVVCWGSDSHGGRGGGAYVERRAEVPGLNDVVQVAAGKYHTCAVRRDGTVVCWGSNERGALGLGHGPGRLGPR